MNHQDEREEEMQGLDEDRDEMDEVAKEMSEISSRIDEQMRELEHRLERLGERIQSRVEHEVERALRRAHSEIDPEEIGRQTEAIVRNALGRLDALESHINPEEIGRKAEEAARAATERLAHQKPFRWAPQRSEAPYAPRRPGARAASSEEIMTILKMVETGKITADEASKLIQSLEG